MTKETDLAAAASPEKVIEILRNNIEQFYMAAGELDCAWQDNAAGKPWQVIAIELEKAIERIQRKL